LRGGAERAGDEGEGKGGMRYTILMDKKLELEKLETEMAADMALPLREANLVFGEGNMDCEVMFVGEAPGQNEDRLKRPFVGRGGQLLDRMIESIGWKRPDVYITNIVKRRPPENRDPSPDEIAAYRPYLTRQIGIIDPKVVVTLGRFSMNYFLPDAKITRDHGRAFQVDGRLIFPVFHPAAALRATGMMNALKDDFKKLPAIVRGEVVVEVPPAIIVGPAHEPKVSKKQKQEKLF